MGLWEIVLPLATTNLVTNPSFELGTTGWNVLAGSGNTLTATRVATYQRRGAYGVGLDFTCGGANSGFYYTAKMTGISVGASYTAAIDVYVPGAIGTGTYSINIYWYDASDNLLAGTIVGTSLNTTGYWTRITVTGTAVATAAKAELSLVLKGGASESDFVVYVDGAQLEQQSAASTYCDGDQDGCTWSAGRHASTSVRTGRTRKGGQIVNLDTLGMYITEIGGIGMPEVTHRARTNPQRPGGELLGYTIQPRTFQLGGEMVGSSWSNMHALRKALIEALKQDAVSEEVEPVLLRYSGADSNQYLEIGGTYDTGMQFGLQDGYTDLAEIRWIAYDPFFYEVGEAGASLTISSSVADADYIIAKLAGVWSALGSGMNGVVTDIEFGPDGSVYACGNFTTAGGTTVNRIAKWNGSAWSALGSTGLSGIAYCMAIDAAGNVYVGGVFATAAGTTVNNVAKWNGSTWSALGSGTSGSVSGDVLDMIIGQDGYLYICGYFDTANGVSCDGIAKWNGTTFVALGSGLDGSYGACLAIEPGTGYIAVGGGFDTANSVTCNGVAKWNGTTFEAFGAGFAVITDDVRALAYTPAGKLYAGGEMSVGNLQLWTGAGWESIPLTDPSAIVETLYYDDEEGLLYVGGVDYETGVSSLPVWNGSVWLGMDVILPGTSPAVNAINMTAGKDLWIGFDDSGTATASYSGTISNGGTRSCYPVIKVKRSGGTTAHLSWIKNETTGKTLFFDYDLMDGEELTIDLRPGRRKISSSYWGDVWRALVRGSDFAAWKLLPGSNQVTTVITTSGSPTMTATAQWRPVYWSADGAA